MRAAVKRFVPLLDRVLVQKAKAEVQTKSGLFLPETAKTSVNEAMVIAAGPGRMNRDGNVMKMSVKVGDKVIIPEYGGMMMKLDGEEYHVFRDDDIIAIFGESQK
eukprot:Selendium_serpulae@DN6270_c0_g1_i1.p4